MSREPLSLLQFLDICQIGMALVYTPHEEGGVECGWTASINNTGESAEGHTIKDTVEALLSEIRGREITITKDGVETKLYCPTHLRDHIWDEG